ncbi:MAG: hypothetical protein RJA55_605 [Acidobacteriota bacterium]|jgi:hypothetical protein
MKNRGRDSAAALAVIGPAGIEVTRRPEAPAELTDEQSEEWRQVVNRLPADWFGRETHAMLTNYCRHVVSARRIAQLIAAAEESDPLDIEHYDRLGKMAERESRIIASLATKMRISQQASYDKGKKKPVGIEKPWD